MKFEQSQNIIESNEGFNSKIRLNFFRHDEKENNPQKTDNDIELTLSGRKHAKAQAQDTNLAQSMAFGSPRRRTQETAGFIMAGQDEDIKGNESFDELKTKIDKNLKYGSKIAIDPRLVFNMGSGSEYVKDMLVYLKKGEFMKFMVEKSDKLAEELGNESDSTYSGMASSIASIIKKYIDIAPRWNELVLDKTKKYEDTLDRFFVTHQSVQESFLAKVIELTKGVEERDRFMLAIKNNGFDYAEGFKTEIITKNSEGIIVHISYKKEGENPDESFEFEENISVEILDEIIAKK